MHILETSVVSYKTTLREVNSRAKAPTAPLLKPAVSLVSSSQCLISAKSCYERLTELLCISLRYLCVRPINQHKQQQHTLESCFRSL